MHSFSLLEKISLNRGVVVSFSTVISTPSPAIHTTFIAPTANITSIIAQELTPRVVGKPVAQAWAAMQEIKNEAEKKLNEIFKK